MPAIVVTRTVIDPVNGTFAVTVVFRRGFGGRVAFACHAAMDGTSAEG
jgi:hypothetical protein